jgi:transcriptional regulator of acetoin/glycerol metabolism
MARDPKTAHVDRVIDAVRNGTSDSPDTSPRLLSSWHRSLQLYGIDPTSPVSPRILTAYELKQIQQQEEDFLLASGQYLSRLHDTLRSAGYCVLLANAQGVTVDYRVDPHLRRQYKEVGLYIGSCWSEREQGTCGIGSALAECTPMTVHKVDHFRSLFTTLTCTAAPILAPDGKLIGVVDASALQSPDSADSQSIVHQLVRHTAQLIEDGYFVKQTAQYWLLFGHGNPHFVEVNPEVLIAFDERGAIVAANREAKQRFPILASGAPAHLSMLFDVREADLFSIDGLQRMTALRSHATSDMLYARIRAPQAGMSPWQPSPLTLPASPRAADDTSVRSAPPSMRVFLDSRDPVIARNARIALRLSGEHLPILILGETGAGKEMFAKAIHASGERSKQPFIAVNCGAIPESLIESELFGYAPGAFTGARSKGARGRIAQADGGTLFLDEIGDMPIDLQTRLLRVLAEGEVLPLGADTPVQVDLSVICATHRDLDAMVASGQFREDLYYRLSGVALTMPALRDRADIEDVIVAVFQDEARRVPRALTLDSTLLARLARHPWPGNVRQLRNVLRYACLLCDTQLITAAHLPADVRTQLDTLAQSPHSHSHPHPPHASVAWHATNGDATGERFGNTHAYDMLAIERSRILDALAEHRWHATRAARALGMSRATLYRRLAKLGIARPRFGEAG